MGFVEGSNSWELIFGSWFAMMIVIVGTPLSFDRWYCPVY